jgi:DNA polymerase (family X)
MTMAKADASEVARLLREYGQRTALKGGNPYRAKAYTRAAENLTAVTEPLETLVREDRLEEIPGVGTAIAEIIKTLHRTGTHPSLDKMRQEIPQGILDLLRVPGLRPEKALKLYRDLGIGSLESLEEAAKAGRIAPVKGLGPALQAKILQSIDILRRGEGQRHIHRAAELLEALARNLKRSHPSVLRVEPAGDFRRGCELVADLALVATVKGARVPEPLASGGTRIAFATKAAEGAALLWATGSPGHVEQMQALAEHKGMRLDSKGLWKGVKRLAGADERSIYEALGLDFIPPELREGHDEIERAQSHRLPTLVEDKDLRGILHAHTDRSDGVAALGEMVKATRARGYQYFGVADHSKSAHYAGGLTVEAIEEQHAEIDAMNAKLGKAFRIFKGIESDILPDGSLDYPDEVLARFDFVVASVHGQFRLDKAKQTERILRAVSNPFTTILGHMTGRQLLRRPGYEIDIDQILHACAKHGVAVEINANPWRLDLDWRWHRRALELGCTMSINPDSHSTSELDLTHWGVEMARKGGVPKDRVLNALDTAAIAGNFQHRWDRARKTFRRSAIRAA